MPIFPNLQVEFPVGSFQWMWVALCWPGPFSTTSFLQVVMGMMITLMKSGPVVSPIFASTLVPSVLDHSVSFLHLTSEVTIPPSGHRTLHLPSTSLPSFVGLCVKFPVHACHTSDMSPTSPRTLFPSDLW